MAEPDLVFLQPGELFASAHPAKVKTILGSCVAITMRAPRHGISAMSHCLLPLAGETQGTLSPEDALRFVDSTVEIMLREFDRRGIPRKELEAKVFGGAQRLDPEVYRIGARNAQVAQSALAQHGIRVSASVTGGRRGCVIEFDTVSGEVSVRRLSGGTA